MLVQILMGINVILGIAAIMGIYHNIVKTNLLSNNHLAHLAVDVKDIGVKLEEIDNSQKTYGLELAKIQATCTERGKQLDKFSK